MVSAHSLGRWIVLFTRTSVKGLSKTAMRLFTNERLLICNILNINKINTETKARRKKKIWNSQGKSLKGHVWKSWYETQNQATKCQTCFVQRTSKDKFDVLWYCLFVYVRFINLYYLYISYWVHVHNGIKPWLLFK